MTNSLHPRLRNHLTRALAALLLVSSTALPAQTTDLWSQQSWSTAEGLPQNSVHDILQASNGYIWIATEDGAARFDGFSFEIFRHSSDPAFVSDDLCCIAEDSKGAIWLGSSSGVVRRQQSRSQHFGIAEGLPSAPVTALATSRQGDLAVLTSDGLFNFSNGAFHQVSPPTPTTHVLAITSSAGQILALTSVGLMHLEGSTLRPDRPTAPVPEAPLSFQVTPAGALWIRSARSVFLQAPQGSFTWTAGQALPGTRVQSLSVDAEGTAWVGTDRGLDTINPADRSAHPIGTIGSEAVLSSASDREGDRWVGTETAGLHILRRRKFTTLPQLADQVITSVVESSDRAIWIGTRDSGLRRLRGAVLDQPVPASALTSPIVLSLAPGQASDLWVGTPDGLNHLVSGRVQKYTSANGLPDDFIRSLLVDTDGSLWIGTRRGLAHMQQGGRIETFTHADGLGSDLIGALLKIPTAAPTPDAGDLWIATFAGLSHLHAGAIHTFTRANGLAGNVVTSIARDAAGSLWIATADGGLSQRTTAGFTSYPQLPAEIQAVVPDTRGALWLRTRRGTARVSIAALQACGQQPGCKPPLVSYGYADGMPSEEAPAVGHPSASITSSGEIWFATRKGVAIVDPEHLGENRVVPPVVLQRFLVDDTAQPLNSTPIRIPPGHARFTFDYAGLSYAAPSKVRYRYILQGFDRDWTDAGSRRSAYYTNLPPRDFTFRVQASSGDGPWNEAGASLVFSVAPPFYRRWWFFLLVALVLAAAIFAIYRMRVRRLQSQFKAVLSERNRIAREIHDTLAQDFVGVSLQLEIAAQLLSRSNLEAASKQIDQTRKLVREGLEDARQTIWELRASTAQDSLPTRLTRAVERAFPSGPAPHLRIGGIYRPLPTNFEDEILRIAQEALANVARHAHATSVNVDLQYGPEIVTLTVQDDGRGFDLVQASAMRGHFGLQGMRERSSLIAAELEITSAPGSGTTLVLKAAAPAAERS